MKKITLLFIFALSTSLCFAQPANDDPAGAVVLDATGAVFGDNPVIGTNVLATASEVADPTIPAPTCSSYAGADVWYAVVVPASGNVTIETNTDGASTLDDTGMSVYSGAIGAFVEIECDDDDSDDGFFSLIDLTGQTPSATLYIRIFEFGGNLEDTFQVSAYEVIPPPVPTNDDFANAAPVSCGDMNIMGDTTNATLDEDDAPDGFGADMDAPNLWYSYDSAIEGAADVTVDLCLSSYDTSFLVYTGTTGNLTLIGGNDDNAAECGAGSLRSQGTFTANGTDVYFIAVEGWNLASTGAFDMSISCVVSCTPAQANQDCASAIGLVVDGSTATVDNTCATLNAATVTCETFSPIADVWYSFDATATGIVGIQTTLNGTATQANITAYSGACGALTEIGCMDDNAAGEILDLTGLNPGETYYLQLWNSGGAEEGTFDVLLSDATLSVGDFDNENAFTYFPNPTKNSLTLRAQNTIQNVAIYNMLGQQVLRTAPNAIESNVDMSSLQTGTYFVQVTINDVTETVRIIKQ